MLTYVNQILLIFMYFQLHKLHYQHNDNQFEIEMDNISSPDKETFLEDESMLNVLKKFNENIEWDIM